MSATVVDRQIAEALDKGFDETFAEFCARTFASYTYPPENLAAARMHSFYLKTALEILSGKEPEGEIPLMDECRVAASRSYRIAQTENLPFCEVFVREWCAFLAI